VKIPDRAEAIRYAVETAAEGDVILLAGKGHENYQLVGVKRIPFSETEILLRAIEERAGMPVS
jgi:UDP-N-acetylmuramoyl-L-alanyl-D-glutamate--2,6-diaminopimelate ligase